MNYDNKDEINKQVKKKRKQGKTQNYSTDIQAGAPTFF